MAARAAGMLTTATILFTDVVDSTATRTRLGEELAEGHFRRYYKLLRAVTTANGSVFIKSLGDGIMAVFESATAGLDAIIAVEQAIAQENQGATEPVTIRAALSAGDVCWGEDDVSGLPTVEAARLVAAADGDQVLCTDLVRRLAQGRSRHEFKDLGPLPGKGLLEPLRTYELLWRTVGGDQTERLPPWLEGSHVLPFVGREKELEALEDELSAARFGARVVLLRGDAGAGKTRLASVIARRAIEERFTILAGRCTDPARQAYEPVAAAVERLARTSPALLLRAGVDQRCGQLVRLAPSLAAPPLALSVPSATEPVSERYHLVAAVRALVERLSDVRPVLLVIDDLHWATAESLQMLQSLVRDAEGLPLLVLATTRPVPFEANAATAIELHRLEAEGRILAVGSLDLEDVAHVLATVARRDANEAERQAVRLHGMTGGNPFLVTELVRDLAHGGDLETLTVPESVTRMVAARLAQLGPHARDLVNLLAVGKRLEPATLSSGLRLDEASFVAAVEEATAAGLITVTPGGPCQFSHELTRNAVYASLSAPRAGLLHGRVADVLRMVDGSVMQSRPYVVATHVLAAVESGGDPGRVSDAAEAVGHAARHALSRLAHREAVTWYQRLLDLYDRIPDTSDERRAESLVDCGRAMWLAGHHDARPTLLRAATLARSCGQPGLIVAAALAGDRGFFSMTAATDPQRIALLTEARELVDPADLRTWALLTAQLASELTWAPDGERRFALSDEALALARQSGDPRTIVSVLGLRSMTMVPAETLAQRSRDGDEMLEAARQTGDDLALYHATTARTGPALDSGDFALVATLMSQAEDLVRRLAQPQLTWLVKFGHASLTIALGDLTRGETEAQGAVEFGVEIGRNLEAKAFYSEQMAEIRRLQGRLGELRERLCRASRGARVDPVHAVLRYLCELGDDDAKSALDRAVDAQGVIPRRDVAQRPALDNLAVAACRLHRGDLVRPLYEALEPHGETFGHSAVAHHCGHHHLAHLAVAAGESRRAAEHFEAAAEVHEACGVPLLLAESLLDWADLIDRTGSDRPRSGDLRRWSAQVIDGRGAVLLERRLGLVNR